MAGCGGHFLVLRTGAAWDARLIVVGMCCFVCFDGRYCFCTDIMKLNRVSVLTESNKAVTLDALFATSGLVWTAVIMQLHSLF